MELQNPSKNPGVLLIPKTERLKHVDPWVSWTSQSNLLSKTQAKEILFQKNKVGSS